MNDGIRSIARDPAGDLLSVGAGEDAVEKYDGASGALLWRVVGPVESDDFAFGRFIAADLHGDVLVAFEAGFDVGFSVVKRSGADGRLLWRFEDTTGLGYSTLMLVDGSGDVMVVGPRDGGIDVVKLNGASGAMRWQSRLPASAGDTFPKAAIDARGDVAVSSTRLDDATVARSVSKVAGNDGRTLWSTVLDDGSEVTGIGFDAGGDVLVGGDWHARYDLPYQLLVEKLDGATGGVRWRNVSAPGTASVFAVDPTDGVVLGGREQPFSTQNRPLVARWNGDGALAWSRVLPDDAGSESVDGIAFSGDTVVVGGAVVSSRVLGGFFVRGLASGDGALRWRSSREGDGAVEGLVGGTAIPVAAEDGFVFVSAGVGDEGSRVDAVLEKLAVDDGTEQWSLDIRETSPFTDDAAGSIALDPDGNLIVGGNLASPETGRRVAAVKLSPTDGRVIWRSVVDAVHGVGRVAVDGAGDVVAAGTVKMGPPTPGGGPAVPQFPPVAAPVALAAVKLSGEDGHEAWRWSQGDSTGYAVLGSLALDGLGDVLATVRPSNGSAPQVIKLDGGRGVPVWSQPMTTSDGGEAGPLVVDAAGDVIAVSNAGLPYTDRVSQVVKLRGTGGGPVWRVELPVPLNATAMALDAQGDALVAASSYQFDTRSSTARLVRKLDGTTGAGIWTRDLGPGDLEAVAVDAAGDVLVAGWCGASIDRGVLSVVKLAGATGDVLWEYATSSRTTGTAHAVVVDASGKVFVAGRVDVASGSRFAMLELNGAQGAVRWVRLHPVSGPAARNDARDVVLDTTGRVVAAGSLFGSEATQLDLGVVSLDPSGRDDDGGCRSARSCGGGPVVVVPHAPGGRLPRH